MTQRFTQTTLAAAIALSCHTAWAADANTQGAQATTEQSAQSAQTAAGNATQAASQGESTAVSATSDTQPASFKPTAGCEKAEDFDPKWDSYGNDYGLKQAAAEAAARKKAKNKKTVNADSGYVWGFYQMAVRDDTLYAAFGGAAPRKGVTPGALVALDADTLAFKKAINLPFAAHALAIDTQGTRAIATHTAANAFSLIDLTSGKINCRKPDTHIDGKEYRGRYVKLDDTGNFYINYNLFGPKGEGRVMKYTPEGEHAQGFAVQPTETGLVIPILHAHDRIYTGTKGLKTVDPASGKVGSIGEASPENNVYNYVAGPGQTLLAGSYSLSAGPNLQLIDTQSGTRSGIFTGLNTVEVGYLPEAGQAFATNYDSGTVTIAALPADAKAFNPESFVNIRLKGHPATLTARRTDKGTDVYVSVKHWDEGVNATQSALLHKIHIAASVKGVDGIQAPGACTVSVFNMLDQSVSKARPCRILDAQETLKAALADTKRMQTELRNDREKVQADLPKARAEAYRAQQKAEEQPSAENQKAAQEAKEGAEGQASFLKFIERGLEEALQGETRLEQQLGN